MTTKQKCDKLAKVLDTVASKLREDIGVQVWENEEPTMQALVAQVHLFLKKAMDISANEVPQTTKRRKKTKELKDEEQKESKILNDWPDILL
jgi:hypothetical protein